MPEKFKRNIAYKFRIGDILIGKPIFNEERFSFLELGEKRIVRVNVIGNIIEKFESQGEKKYCFMKIDDGSGQISLKTFGDDVEKTKEFGQGETVVVIGTLRSWNNELYILPEIIKKIDPKYLLVRKLEIEKNRSQEIRPIANQEKKALKDNILEKIKNSEKDGGIEIDKIITEIREASPDMINQEIRKFIEEGIIFEPRPGIARYLG